MSSFPGHKPPIKDSHVTDKWNNNTSVSSDFSNADDLLILKMKLKELTGRMNRFEERVNRSEDNMESLRKDAEENLSNLESEVKGFSRSFTVEINDKADQIVCEKLFIPAKHLG